MRKNYVYTLLLLSVVVFAMFYYVTQVQTEEDFVPSLQVVLEYEDGTSGTFSPKRLPLFSNSIIDSTNKQVRNMRVELYVKTDYSGSAIGWEADGSLRWQVLDASKNVKTSVSMPLSQSGSGAPPKNTAFVITSATVSASDIEAMYTGWQAGQTYYLRFEVQQLNFKLKFSDGTSQTKSASAAFEWKFRYESSNQFTSLSVTWQPVTYY